MKYRIFESVEKADTVSRAEAITRGCSGVTTYWWQILVHPDGRAALALQEADTIEGETVSEVAMHVDGWVF
jgi:hypothetical protein